MTECEGARCIFDGPKSAPSDHASLSHVRIHAKPGHQQDDPVPLVARSIPM